MDTLWFRRPDGVLVAGSYTAQVDRFRAVGYEPVPAAQALAEIESGVQQRLTDRRTEADIEATSRRLAVERQQKQRQRREAAARVVADAKLAAKPPRRPRASQEATKAAREERG